MKRLPRARQIDPRREIPAVRTLTVLAWNLLGDALRDIWDPKLRVGR